ncbi:MAG: DUF2961 domain-containing protein [Planctomycetia bacterium]|nr:DUF2961 domain-containing protein [Planctomycetia bacterium]
MRRTLLGLCSIVLFSMALDSTLGQEPPLYEIQNARFKSIQNYYQDDVKLTVPKGEEVVIAEVDGPGLVTYFYFTDDSNGKWYSGLVLRVYWDGASEPSINVPITDFFGCFNSRTVDFQSLPMRVHERCYMCHLPMPFAKHARFVLYNDGDLDYVQNVAYNIDFELGEKYASEPSRLHARYNRENTVQNGLYTFLEIPDGQGHFVGQILQINAKTPSFWYGEGDMIFTVDGEEMHHSGGTEDEYGSVWTASYWSVYDGLYCGHYLDEKEDGKVLNRMYRWYLTNPVRFQKSFKAQIQNHGLKPLPWEGSPHMISSDDYTSVVFWYQNGANPVELMPYAQRTAE